VTRPLLPCDDPDLAAQVPPRTLDGLRRYARDHAPVGSFLTAVLSNSLDAVCLADDENRAALKAIVLYVHHCLPPTCHGNREAVRKWTERRADR
jgi:hypothetical protein